MKATPHFTLRARSFRREASPLKTLTVAMTVMCYLACLAIGALILIDRAVDNWTGGLAREVTVQVRKVEGHRHRGRTRQGGGIARSDARHPRCRRARPQRAATRLLEPWLGTIGDLDQLPVPRLIAVTIDPRRAARFRRLVAIALTRR